MKHIANFPRFRQAYNYDCGAAAMQSVLAYYGFDVSEGEIMKITGTIKKGTPIKGLKKIAKKFGIKFREGKITADMLKKNISAGRPTIITLQAWSGMKVKDWSRQWAHGHYVIPIGYDDKRFYFADPMCFVKTYLSFAELEKRWHDTDGKKVFEHWGIVFYGKKPKYNPNKAVRMGV